MLPPTTRKGSRTARVSNKYAADAKWAPSVRTVWGPTRQQRFRLFAMIDVHPTHTSCVGLDLSQCCVQRPIRARAEASHRFRRLTFGMNGEVLRRMLRDGAHG